MQSLPLDAKIRMTVRRIALLAFTALAVYILEGDATIAIFTVPLALYMIFSREMCIVNSYYWETKERETNGRKDDTAH